MQPRAVKYMLMAEDMERATVFYRDVLGFEEGFLSPHWSELKWGDAILALHAGGDGSKTKTGLSLEYADVRAAFAAAIAGGGTAVQEPVQREGEPIMLGVLADPEGNEIMLTQYMGG